MIEARVHDFRIDARLRRVCKDQMQDCVGMDIYEGDETIVNICLQVSNPYVLPRLFQGREAARPGTFESL
jgi:hypothetical protein